MQQIMIYWQSIITQHVSGVFTPIIRRADCLPLPMVSCPGYGCCGSGESGSEMCALCRGCCLTIARTGNHRQWEAVYAPDDGRKDARNMLRNTWLPINLHLLHLVGLALICLGTENSSCPYRAIHCNIYSFNQQMHTTAIRFTTIFLKTLNSYMFRTLLVHCQGAQ